MKRVMKSLSKKLGQAGQGTVEYVLLLGLTVAIIFGVVLQFNNAFKVWADNYFGEYLTCLLETGELPSLGGPQGSGECQPKAFALSDGGGKDGKDGSSGSGGGGSEDDKNEDSASGGGSSRPTTASADSASSINRSRAGRSRVIAARGGAGGSGGDEDSKKGDDQNGEGSFNSYNQNKNGGQQRILVKQSESSKKRRIEEGKKDRTRTKVKSDTDLAGDRQGAPALQKYKKRVIASAGDGDEGFEFSFGNILRWLLIAALIIAIVLFIGGQVLQVSKSID